MPTQPKSPGKAPSGHRLSKTEKKQRLQQKLINGYKRQQKWLLWAGIIILILILFLIMTVGYSYNWGKDNTASNDALKQLSTGTTASGQKAATAGATASTDNGGGSGTNTTSTTGTTKDSTDTGSTTSTTNNSTTTSTTNTTNNPTTPADPNPPTPPTVPANLLTLAGQLGTGNNINAAITTAQGLGVSTSCHTDLLVVKVCDFTSGGNTITAKSLLTNDLITSVTKNF